MADDLHPRDLERGEINLLSTSFAVGRQVLDHVIAHHNAWVAFGVHAASSSVVAGEDGRVEHTARLVYHGTRERDTLHFYGLEDPAGVEIALLVVDEDEVANVGVLVFDGWSAWSVWMTLAGGTRIAIGALGSVG